MARVFNDGPLTVTPALTITVPKGVFNDKGDTTGSNPNSKLSTPALRQSPVAPTTRSVTVPVQLHNVPGYPDGGVFVINGPTDMGALFTQGQLDNWQDLMVAIQAGYLLVTVAGTVPADHSR